MNRDEMLNFLKNEARGISVMFGPNCETIVHDMTRPGHPILAIFNGTVTGREVGSTADIFGDIGDYDESIYQNKDYINQMVLSRDGRTLKSSTFNIVGEDYHFALGFNLDITNMVRAGQMLSELTATSGDLQQTLMQDARSQLEELLRECISAVGKEPEAMKKTDRMRIIRMLYKRRAFTYQKSVAIVAERLNVSRYTVYKYMHELEEAEAVKAQVKADAARLAQLEDARRSELDCIRLVEQPALRLVLLRDSVKFNSYLWLERSIRKIEQDQKLPLSYIGKVGVGISGENLKSAEFGHYDLVFLVLEEDDVYDGRVETLPPCRCAAVRFRGDHSRAPQYYEQLAQFLAANGLQIAGFSREITLIDNCISDDPAQYVTEIRIPVARG